MENKEKLTILKTQKNIDQFLSGEKEEKKVKPWKMILTFSKEEEDKIKKSFGKSTYKAMYRFLIDAVLSNKDFIKKED